MNRTFGSSDVRSFLETAAASVSVLAAAGYVSLRSFANFIGLAGLQELSIQQLLYECYAIVVAFMIMAVPLGSLAFAVYLLCRPVVRLLHLSKASKRLIRLHQLGLFLQVIMFFAVIALLFYLFRSMAADSLLLQPIEKIATFQQRPHLFIISVGLSLFMLSLAKSQRAAAYVRHNQGRSNAIAFRWLVGGLAILFLWSSIVTYNTQIRALDFPGIIVQSRSERGVFKACGLLVYSTSNTRFLWQVVASKSPQGVLTALSNHDLDEVTLLPIRSPVAIAREVQSGRPGIPECSGAGNGSGPTAIRNLEINNG